MEETRGKSEAMKLYGRLISVVMKMRKSSMIHKDVLMRAEDDSPDVLKFPKLIAEILELPDSFVDKLETDLSNLQL